MNTNTVDRYAEPTRDYQPYQPFQPDYPQQQRIEPAAPQRTRIDEATYCTGIALTAVVAVLTAVLGMIISRGILQIPVLESGVLAYVLGVAGIALGAGALFFAMLHFAPRPSNFYAALAVLGIALAVAVPFTILAALSVQAALAITNLAVGGTIAVMVPLSASHARR
jgi:hypothetical protein